ncbi:hypothetical protein [Labedaea rhizosphaerae]|uniref:hypothetical protein n=1 Tax=Labedaea rhizosphaerae TaxID=598644 RepID=UPI00105F001B|nr:hypothetical protein [Labedaea rhizosphaerae]
MTQWIRYYWPDDDIWHYLEIDDSDGHASRHVELQGSELRPTGAATLTETLAARDAGLAAMQRYERAYGVLPEGDCRNWDGFDAELITVTEFDEAWTAARRALDQRT